MTQRYLFKNTGSNSELLSEALELAYTISKENNQDIHLVFPYKSNFESTDFDEILDESLGRGTTKKLSKGDRIQNIDFILPSRLNYSNSSGVILAVYCTEQDMNKIDTNTSADSIIFVSSLLDEAESWENRWTNRGLTIKHGIPSQAISSLPPEVEQELERLTKVINLSTGLAHPSDKEMAKKIFKSLKDKGYTFDVQDVLDWAVRNGWNERHLKDLEKIANKYSS